VEAIERERMSIRIDEINNGDIVKIIAGLEKGKYAKVLRIGKGKRGDEFFTLKVNNYWRSKNNIIIYGDWNGQLWHAVVLQRFEIELKKGVHRANITM
jgi:hypothetical protein